MDLRCVPTGGHEVDWGGVRVTEASGPKVDESKSSSLEGPSSFPYDFEHGKTADARHVLAMCFECSVPDMFVVWRRGRYQFVNSKTAMKLTSSQVEAKAVQ